MKILKYSLIIILFIIFGCNSDQSNLDVVTEEERVANYQTNSVSAYSLEEILNGIRKWIHCATVRLQYYLILKITML